MMITYKDIKIAINTRLKTLGIEITSRDVTEGFKRPSFFVQLDNSVRSADENQVYKSMTVEIYYFPSDRYEYSVEVLDIQERLENLFDLKLPIKDRLINIDEANTIITDGVLNFSFELAFYDGREQNKYDQYPSELMFELDFEKVEE